MFYKSTCAKTEKPNLKRIIMYTKVNAKEHERTNMKLKFISHMDLLKVARDDTNLVSLFSSFHNFSPR